MLFHLSESFRFHSCAHMISLIYWLESERNPNMESLYDYGSRAGFWRYHRLFTSRKIPITVFAVGMVRYVHVYAYNLFSFTLLGEL